MNQARGHMHGTSAAMSAKIILVDVRELVIAYTRTIKVNTELVSGIAIQSLQETTDRATDQVKEIRPICLTHE